ncbi:MAG: response regulator [Desulfobacteraceae bacterium]|nr:response regulator [Desulfobacteraceae bacterium]
MKILVVDDDPGILNAFRVNLISFGYRVLTTSNGQDALDILDTNQQLDDPVDILVSDLRMNGMSGNDLIYKSRIKHTNLKAVLMTAYGNDAVIRQVRNMGCAYLDKPFSPEKLMDILNCLNVNMYSAS